MEYTLVQVRGYLRAINRQRRAALLDEMDIARAAQSDKDTYKSIRDELAKR